METYGGDPDAAFRIARCLRHNYSEGSVVVYISGMCKSAGTLITLAATTLVMSDHAELGPLDIQIAQPDEVGASQSGLVPMQALHTLEEESFRLFETNFLKLRQRSGLQITTRTAAEIAANLTVGLYSSVYSQIDPLRLGETYRSMQVAENYADRVQSDNVKIGTVDKLVGSYPSHSFVIDRDEAKELFDDVREPTESLLTLSGLLKSAIGRALQNSVVHQDPPLVENLTTIYLDLGPEESDPANGEINDNKAIGNPQHSEESISGRSPTEDGAIVGRDATETP